MPNSTPNVGDFIKARFWPGETIWAQVTAINGGAVDAVLANDPAASDLAIGAVVSCGADEVIEVRDGQ